MDGSAKLIWWIDVSGKLECGQPGCPDRGCAPFGALAAGWVTACGSAGCIEAIDGRPASLAILSHGIVDVLDRRFSGAKWQISDRVGPTLLTAAGDATGSNGRAHD